MNVESVIRSPVVSGVAVTVLLARLTMSGLSWAWLVALVAAILWFGITLIDWLYHSRDRRRAGLEALEQSLSEIQAPLSLVMLLDEPRTASLKAVRTCVSHALDWDAKNLEEEDAVVEAPAAGAAVSRDPVLQQFLVRLPTGVFGISLCSRPYIADPSNFAKRMIRDKRLRKAVETHAAWVSVDLVSATPEEPEGRTGAYEVIGKILGALAGPDCLAIYAPELSRCNEFDPALIERLNAGRPLSIFEEPTFEPVLEIEEDDPRMMAAVEEALRRWPEFVAAFHKRDQADDDRYIVKAEFSEGDRSEFMWVSVTDLIGGGRIRGILMNDPHELENVHRGMSVTVELDCLNDWLFPGGDGPVVGGFTLDVLTDREGGSENAGGA